ncbi:MAG: YdcF family protein [Candidatus Acidiferrales bacterium]
MPTPETPAQSGHRKNRGRRELLLILLLAFAIGAVAFRDAGHWLVREDPLGKADVLVVLSGGMPYRADGAASLFKSGYAPEVWVTRPEGPQQDLAAIGIHFVGEEEYKRQILVHEGVPDSAITILPDVIVNTQQEVGEISREMRRTGKHTVIIVTSPEHTRRVKALWAKLVGDDPRLLVRAAPDDPFDANRWWGNTRDALAVVREYLGLLNVWAGLPVRPHAQQ